VDGRNPAPVDRWFIPLFKGGSTIQGGAGFLPSAVCLNIYTYRNDLMTSESVYLHTTKNALMYCLFEHVLIRVPLCAKERQHVAFFFIHYRAGFRSVTLGLGTKFHRRDASWP